MKRKIIEIDKDKCNGCGLCATACHEGAIGMVDGKAELLRDDFCDGLGDCLPACPTGAISFVEREALEYNEAAVVKSKQSAHAAHASHAHGCPSARAAQIERAHPVAPTPGVQNVSELTNWPVQIKLAPIRAPFFDNANLLIAADCAAYARADFHAKFMHGKIALIGCPKLDSVDYTEKLAAIIAGNDIKSLTVIRMQVPCCGGIEQAAANALKSTGKFIPWQVITIAVDGNIVE